MQITFTTTKSEKFMFSISETKYNFFMAQLGQVRTGMKSMVQFLAPNPADCLTELLEHFEERNVRIRSIEHIESADQQFSQLAKSILGSC